MNPTLPKEYESTIELKKIIKEIDKTKDFSLTPQMIFALGQYLLLLKQELKSQELFIFKDDFLPIPLERYKMWCFDYLVKEFLKKRKILKYQEDGGLSYTAFQSMTDYEWDLFKGRQSYDIYSYYTDIKNKGKSSILLPAEIKSIINKYINEFKSEQDELYELLNSLKPQNSYYKAVAMFFVLLMIIYFLFF